MKTKRGLEAAGATILSALVFAVSAPTAQAGDQLNPNQNPTNRLAKQEVKKIGRWMLSKSHQIESNADAILETRSNNSSGAASLSITIDIGRSLVAGSSGEYIFSAFSDDIGRDKRLDASDINTVRVAEGSAPSSEGRPLFALRLGTTHPHATGPNEGGNRGWYGAQGTAVLNSGAKVFFGGSINPSRFATPPALVLDRSEVQATTQIIDEIVQAASDGRPTQLEKPPFGPLQPDN